MEIHSDGPGERKQPWRSAGTGVTGPLNLEVFVRMTVLDGLPETPEIVSFVDRLSQSRGETDVWDAAADYFASLGFASTIHLNISPGGTKLHTTLPESWLDRYHERGYAAVDPFLAYCCRTREPIFTGVDYLDRYSYLGQSARQMITEASTVGFRAGVSVTTKVASRSGSAGWNLGSSLPRSETERILKEHFDVIRLAAHFADEKLRATAHPKVKEGVDLSSRERDCLQLCAFGLRTKEIAHRLSLRPVTIDLYLKNARLKLGAATREQAVALAILRGLICL